MIFIKVVDKLPLITLLIVVVFTGISTGCTNNHPIIAEIPNDVEVALISMTTHPISPLATAQGIDSRTGGEHLAVLPKQAKDRTGKLLIFFPGTGAQPSWYTSFVKQAVQNGFHALSLDYENSQSINFEVCPDQPPDCHEASRLEILTGADSPYIEPDVNKINSAYNRLLQLLKYLANHFPDESWDDYFIKNDDDPESALVWKNMVVAGHSQEGGHAAMTARLHVVQRVILFGATEPASWTLKSFATPADRFWGLVHKKEPIFNGIFNSWNNIGIPGELTEVGTQKPPIPTQRLTTIAEGGTGDPQSIAYHHNLYIVDGWMPAPSKEGTFAFAPLWDYLLTAPCTTYSLQKAQKISPAGTSWIDPEILNVENKIAFQVGGSGTIWLSDLDPVTGLFASPNGTDLTIDRGATPLIISLNGPEFGLDTNGWSIFYTKAANGGTSQPWRAIVNDSDVTTLPLTSGNISRLSVLATKDSSANSIRLLYGKGARLKTSELAWTDEDNPSIETVIDQMDSGVRWIDGSHRFVYTKQTGPKTGQLAVYNTETQTETIITSDADIKTYSYGWFAPEYDELLVMCVINYDSIGIYKHNGDSYWQRIITLEAPSQAEPFKYFGSPEPFTANQKSYISFVLKPEYATSTYVNAEVWVMDLEPDLNRRFMLRCDDGVPHTIRTDPESFRGTHEVFIYYNQINSQGVFEIWRCATGIPTTHAAGTRKKSDVYPNAFYFKQNYPQGVTSSAAIQFSVPSFGEAELKSYDVPGRNFFRLQMGHFYRLFTGRCLPLKNPLISIKLKILLLKNFRESDFE